MKKIWFALILSLMLFLGETEQTYAFFPVLERVDSSAPVTRILMIGNSYTGYNNLPGILKKICTSKGKRVEIRAVMKGSACLSDFASHTTSVGKKVHRLLKNQKWDYVILQERHDYPLINTFKMEKAIFSLLPYIEATGAQTALYMTWAPAEGHQDYQRYKSLVSERDSYQKKVAVSYRKIADKTGAVLIPAGLSFQNVIKHNKNISLIRRDKSHPTKNGSYLAACTMYAALFHESSEGAGTAGLDRLTARTLQKMSWYTWKNNNTWNPVLY